MKFQLALSALIIASSLVGCSQNTSPDLMVIPQPGSSKVNQPKEVEITYECDFYDKVLKNDKAYALKVPELTGLSEARNVILTVKMLNGNAMTTYCYLEADGTLIGTRTPTNPKLQVVSLSEVSENQRIPVTLVLGNSGYGESFKITVVAADQNNKPKVNSSDVAVCKIIPNPLEVVDEQRHKISLEALEETGSFFRLTVSNLTPNETLTMNSRSCNEEIAGTITADNNGTIVSAMAPGVVGRKEGFFEVTFSSDTMKPLSISHIWGRNAFLPPRDCDILKRKLKKQEELKASLET